MMVRGECEDEEPLVPLLTLDGMVEALARLRDSRDVLQEWAGLSLLGDTGDTPPLQTEPTLRPEPREELVPPLAREVVEPSLAMDCRVDEDRLGDDCDGCSFRPVLSFSGV